VKSFESVTGWGLTKGAILLTGALALSGCAGSGGRQAGRIEPCKDGQEKGIKATLDTKDENDPFIILKYAQEGGHGDYHDDEGQQFPNFSFDRIDGIGEVVCRTEIGESEKLIFLPGAAKARADYMNDADNVLDRVRESNKPG
jgi:hypothetical protein